MIWSENINRAGVVAIVCVWRYYARLKGEGMIEEHWRVLGKIQAGDVWAEVAEHPSIGGIDSTHCETQMSMGLLLSPTPNHSRGCFLTDGWQGGHAPLGSIVAVPGGVPFHVSGGASPARRILHCLLPDRESLKASNVPLQACLDLRDNVLAQNLKRLAYEVTVPGFGTSAIVEGLGLLIAGEMERLFGAVVSRQGKGGLAPWQLRGIDEYLRSGHWSSSVSDLARLCGVSTGHLMRAFRQSTGQSVGSYIAWLRSDHACTMLADGSLSIAEIATELRFANASAFAAAFKRSMGVSPSPYRQRQRA